MFNLFGDNDQTKYEDLLVKLTKIFRLRLYIEIKIKNIKNTKCIWEMLVDTELATIILNLFFQAFKTKV